ncbi:MAG: type II toxin-antitoxin system HipA family toxin YjjJ, partial [Proteobacteria bacterium]|nr:type II toxin-antitoxin system HipA family toxin YjjJ [Pseudomonadota bacterium]
MSSTVTSAVVAVLGRGPAAAAQLVQSLGVSQATISRAVAELERQQQVLRTGTRRGTRYLLRRARAELGSQWPIFRLDADGTPQPCGTLNAVAPEGYYAAAGPGRLSGLYTALPYYLLDAWPAGFLGRTIPTRHADLELPARVGDWTEDHFLTYLTRRANDSSGDLVVGAEALDRHLTGVDAPLVVTREERHIAYPEFATAAMSGAPPGSSAHGEHPKFTVCLAAGARRTHVLVKFSPPRSSAVGQRWADLLRAEHLAHGLLNENGIASCTSQLLEHGERVFLECERYDRIGATGLRGVVSLHALDTARYGRLDNWTAAADRLFADALLSEEGAERIRLLDAFGALIGNTDRHFGNLSLFDDYANALRLAPVYDMLPMVFAPHDGQVLARAFTPPPARAAWLASWASARRLAEEYWERLRS